MRRPDQNEEALESALAALKRDGRGTKGRIAISVSLGTLSLFLAILGVGWLTAGRSAGIVPLFLALLCILIGGLTVPQSHHHALDALLPIADARAIGPLLDLLPAAYAGKRKAILSLLIHLLPQLQDRDTALLQPSHRSQLRSALLEGDFQQENEYLLAILKAIAQIGNSDDLAVVSRIAIGQSDSWQERQVREAARACLPRLRAHVEQLKHRDMLLRPAFAVAPEELLHPAIAESDPNPTQLLRPNQTNREQASSED